MLAFFILIIPFPSLALEGEPQSSPDAATVIDPTPQVTDSTAQIPLDTPPISDVLNNMTSDTPLDTLPDATSPTDPTITPEPTSPAEVTPEEPTVPTKDDTTQPSTMSQTPQGIVGNPGSWSVNDAGFKPTLPEVDKNTGALVYSYPLSVPPGRNGLQPNLNLVYNNQITENASIVGHGWNLDIPYIERINKDGTNNLYSENYYNSSLTGELVSTATTTFISKVENGDFLNYTFASSTWTVMDKTGTVYKFGSSAASRQDDPDNSSHIFKWMLVETRDSNDNYIKYEYTKNSGQIYPSKITYTGHGSTDGLLTVDFATGSRNDDMVSYKTGFGVRTNYRITSITASFDSSWVKKYEFAYTGGSNTERSLLSSVTESGRTESAQVAALPALSFQYATDTPTWVSGGVSVVDPPEDETSGTKIITDVNADALPDFVFSYDACTYNGYPPPDECPYPLYNSVYISDGEQATLDGDKVPPIYFFKDEERNSTTGIWHQGARIVDLNGDNYADIIQARTANASQSQPVTKGAYLNDQADDWVSTSTFASTIELLLGPGNEANAIDMNGDGLPDLFFGPYIQFNTGTSFTASSTSWNPSVDPARIVDINGDGLPDIAATVDGHNNIYLNKGNGSWTLESSLEYPLTGSEMLFVDLNSDGLADQIKKCNYGEQPTSYINTGTGWTQKNEYAEGLYCAGLDQNAFFTDINGDGLLDEGSSMVKQGEVPDLLKKIIFPAGGNTAVTYKSSALYKDSQDNRLNPKLPFVVQTVQQLNYNDGNGNSWNNTYSYEGGQYYFNSSLERKFAGFSTITDTDAPGNVTKTYFHQGDSSDSSHGEYSDSYWKIGKSYRVESYDNSGNLYKKTISKWDSYDLGNDAAFIKLAQTVDSTYEGDSSHKDKAESYSYGNTSGNLTQKVEWGEVTGSDDGTFSDTGSDKFITDLTYATSSTSSVVSLLDDAVVTDQSSNKVKESKYYYDTLSFGSVDKGNLTKQEDWKTGSSYIDTEKTYNSYGLVTQIKDSRDKATNYTYDSYNLYPATVTNPLSKSVQYTYDYSSGRTKQTTDPNGLIFQTVYDGLDRIIEQKQPDLTTSSTLVTALAVTYTDTSNATKVKESKYLDSGYNVDTYTYFDGLHRPIQQRKAAEDENYAVKDIAYNNLGLVQKETLPYFSAGYATTTATSTLALYINYAYDALQRLKTSSDAVGTSTNAYLDWKVTLTDPNGKTKDLINDAYGRLIEVDEHNASSTYVTTYTYDYLGDLTNITDALSNVRNFTYDGLGRRLTAQDLHASGDGTYGSYSYTYDDSGNLTQKVDPKSQTINYTYDDINRILTEDYTGTGGTEVTYTYDSCTYGIGSLCTASSTAVTTSNVYNSLKLLSQETKTINGTNYITLYSYNWQGNQINITNPDSSQVKYIYNSVGLLEQVQRKEFGDNDFTDVITNFDYSPTNQVTSQTYANGSVVTNTYDASKLYRLVHKVTTVPSTQSRMQIVTPPTEELNKEIIPEEIIPEVPISPTGTSTLPSEIQLESPTSTPDFIESMSPTSTPEEVLPSTKPLSLNSQPSGFSFSKVYNSVTSGVTKVVRFIAQQFTLKTASAAAVELYDTPLYSDSNLVSYYRLSSGGLTTDSKGSHTLTNNNSVSETSGGKFGYAADFGSGNTNKTLYVSDKLGWTGGAYTISVWVKLSTEVATGEEYHLAEVQDATSKTQLKIYYSKDSTGYFLVYQRNKNYIGGQHVAAYTSAFGTSAWHHLVITYDNTNINAYLDGSAFSSPVAASGNGSTAGTNISSIGTGNNASGLSSGWTKGIIDDVAMFDRALTADEVSHLYLGDWDTDPPAGTIVQDLSYNYDANGNITRIVNASPNNASSTVDYIYDDLNRLTSASSTAVAVGQSSYLQTYTYDAIGNITNKSDLGNYTYSGSGYTNPHAVTSIGSTSYSYDNNGNLTAGDTNKTYTWDYNNRLTQTVIGGASTTTVTSAYDPGGQRVKYTVATGTSSTIYYPSKYFNIEGLAATKHIFANGELIATVTTASSTNPATAELYLSPLNTDSNLVSYYRMNSGALTTDSKGSNTLTNNNSVAETSSGKFGYAADFGSSNSTKSLTKDYDYTITGGNVTLSAWVKLYADPTSGQEFNYISVQDAGNKVYYYISNENVSGTNYLKFTRGKSYVGEQVSSSVNSLGTTNWHHLVLTYDGTYIRGYLDGSLVSGPTTASGNGSTAGTDSFAVGASRAGSGGSINKWAPAYMDDVAVFNRALTVDEVSNLHSGTWTTTVAPAMYSVITDHLSGSSLILDDQATVVQLLDYYPYGSARLDEQSGSFDEQSKFTGHEFDSDSGLYYMNARYQNPTTGRFISQDPAFINLTHLNVQLADPQSWNSYAYARNNPIVFIDPYGNMWTPWQSSGGFGNWMGNGGFMYNVYGSNVNGITNTAMNIQQNGLTADNIMALGADVASITAKTSGVIVGSAAAGMGAGVAVESGAAGTVGNALFNSQAAVRGGINATMNVGSQVLSDKVEGKQTSLGDYAKIAGLSYVGGALINTKSVAINAGGFGATNAITQGVTGDHSIDPVKVGGATLGGAFSSWASNYLSTSGNLGLYTAQQYGLGRIGWSVETPISILRSGTNKK